MRFAAIQISTRPTFVIFSESDIENEEYQYLNLDDIEERDEEYMQALGFLALMSGRLPHEIFEDPDWNRNILFNMRVSNLTWRIIIDILKARY